MTRGLESLPRQALRADRWLKAGLRRRYGVWPLLEVRNKAILGPRTLPWRRFEEREVRRLEGAFAQLPHVLVTTVVPTFRRPKLLQAAVTSALAQTVSDHRVVVVDDGGGLPDLPKDPRLVAVSLSRNTHRLGLVRNVGIRLSKSTYIAFLDDDNQWYPTHLEQAIGALQQGADLVYTAVERFWPDGSPLDVLSREFNRQEFADCTPYVDANALVVRRTPWVRFSIIPRVTATVPKEDWEFVWRMSGRMCVRHVPEATVRYLLNDSSYYTVWGPQPS